MVEHLQKILVSEDDIQRRLRELGRDISAYYGGEEIVLVSIINGSIPLAADLMRILDIPLKLDCIRVSSYRDDTQPVTKPEIIDKLRLDVADQRVLLIDDIFDTGETLAKVVNLITEQGPRDVRTCVLLEKQGRREVVFRPDYVGFEIPDEFVVGYGLDFAENYRQLPCIGVLKPEFQNPPVWQTE